MIQVSGLQLMRGSKELLQQANCQIHPGQKIAIIGANGCGKSSFFKLLLGQLTPDQGECSIPKQWRISHMAQEVNAVDRSAIDYVIDGDQKLRSLQRQLQDAENKQDESALVKAHSEMDHYGGYQYKHTAEQLLTGLGFTQNDFEKPINSFSGGWRIRLNLAQALMCQSDLLLLDEPTNHLDIEACYWLEDWLKSYQGTLVFVSHDREFIDGVASQILSFEQQSLFTYTGNYSQYERQKAARIDAQNQSFEKQQERIKDIESFVARFRAKASKAKQAQSRLKELDRMTLIAPAHFSAGFEFNFPCTEQTSTPLISTEALSIGYGSPLASNIEIRLDPGMRIGLLGSNGAGKSTLIKNLIKKAKPLSGKIQHGQNLKIGYFAQHQLEALDENASAILHIQRIAPNASEQQIRNFVGAYGFIGDRAEEAIGIFSGGEKARLALALVAWEKPNLLLLDEPTNHLDLEIRHALTMALQTYPGALVIISHDRHLLKNTVDEFWYIHDGVVAPFDGDLEDFHQFIQAPAVAKPKAVNTDRKEQKRKQAEIRQKLSPVKKKLDKSEKLVESTQLKLDDIEAQLADANIYSDENKKQLKDLLEQQTTTKQALAEYEEQWMELQEEYELLEQELNQE